MAIGECWLQRVGGDPLRIVRADPQIFVTAEVLTQVVRGELPGVTYADGGVLTIRAENQTAVYVVGEYDPRQRAFRAEWPD